MPTDSGDGDWAEYRRLILQELQRLHEGIGEVKGQISALTKADIAEIRAEIAVLKFKSGLWGFVAGALPSSVTALYVLLR
jgi:hypothetical protein